MRFGMVNLHENLANSIKNDRSSVFNVKALVINPGNTTEQVFNEDTLKSLRKNSAIKKISDTC